MGQIHPTGLTPNLLKLFEPRPPLEYKPPLEKRKLPAYTGESVESGAYLLSSFSLLYRCFEGFVLVDVPKVYAH
jgi:hypothetical protein